MEPWDGPACVVFTDGSQIGAVLDRNGLRPSRYWVTDDGLVVLASEVGVLDLDPATIVRKGRLQPGRMFLVDTDEHRIIEDDEIKADARRGAPVRRVAARRPDPPRRHPRARAHRAHARLGHPAPAGLRLHRGGAARPAHADGQRRRRADRLDGHRHPDRGAQRASRGCSSTTPPRALWSPHGLVVWPPRSACSTSTRPPSSARAGCSPAGCSSSTPTSTGSSRTRRSRPSSPPSTRTTSGCTPA